MVNIQKKSVSAGQLVNTNHVKTLLHNYKQERWVHNSQRLGKEDSLSVWYSLEELQNFMKQVEELGGTGIRVYFGVYDQQFASDPLHAGRQTVVFVGTKDNTTGEGSLTKDMYYEKDNQTSVLAFNAGRPCPPFCTHDDTWEFGYNND